MRSSHRWNNPETRTYSIVPSEHTRILLKTYLFFWPGEYLGFSKVIVRSHPEISTFITALKYPTLAAAACGLFAASRVVYTLGYITGDPENRHYGIIGYALNGGRTIYNLIDTRMLTQHELALALVSVYTAYGVIRDGMWMYIVLRKRALLEKSSITWISVSETFSWKLQM